MIMFYVNLPRGNDGAYNTRVSFDVFDDAMLFVCDAVDNTYAHHAIIVTDDDSVIGVYHGDVVRGDDDQFPRTNYGPDL